MSRSSLLQLSQALRNADASAFMVTPLPDGGWCVSMRRKSRLGWTVAVNHDDLIEAMRIAAGIEPFDEPSGSIFD